MEKVRIYKPALDIIVHASRTHVHSVPSSLSTGRPPRDGGLGEEVWSNSCLADQSHPLCVGSAIECLVNPRVVDCIGFLKPDILWLPNPTQPRKLCGSKIRPIPHKFYNSKNPTQATEILWLQKSNPSLRNSVAPKIQPRPQKFCGPLLLPKPQKFCGSKNPTQATEILWPG